MNGEELHNELRCLREKFDNTYATRLHRSISWIKAADLYNHDHDIAFITLWIAFNTCYAIDSENDRIAERQSLNGFVAKLVETDSDRLLYKALWQNFSGFVRTLLVTNLCLNLSGLQSEQVMMNGKMLLIKQNF